MSYSLSHDQIQLAYRKAAKLVKRYGDQYLPTFERLHEEVQKINQTQRIKTLAFSIADDTLSIDE